MSAEDGGIRSELRAQAEAMLSQMAELESRMAAAEQRAREAETRMRAAEHDAAGARAFARDAEARIAAERLRAEAEVNALVSSLESVRELSGRLATRLLVVARIRRGSAAKR
ncbi:MAG: hypothetical protein ACKOYN_12375 [Planctomycetota bacterium]